MRGCNERIVQQNELEEIRQVRINRKLQNELRVVIVHKTGVWILSTVCLNPTQDYLIGYLHPCDADHFRCTRISYVYFFVFCILAAILW